MLNNCWKKMPKMDKIANISVRNISKVGFTQISSTPTFLNVLGWDFQYTRKRAICTYNGGRFLLKPLKKFGGQILACVHICWNLAAKLKIRPRLRCKMHLYPYLENFSQKYRKMWEKKRFERSQLLKNRKLKNWQFCLFLAVFLTYYSQLSSYCAQNWIRGVFKTNKTSLMETYWYLTKL